MWKLLVPSGNQALRSKVFFFAQSLFHRQQYSSVIVDFNERMESTESQQQQSLSAVDPEKKHLIEQNISTLQSKITQLCNEFGRPLDPPLLIAVTKKVPIMEIKVAYDAGLKHFAENYVQDLEQKISQVFNSFCLIFVVSFGYLLAFYWASSIKQN